MTENVKMTKDIDNLVRGNMDMTNATELLRRISASEKWIDHLILEIELHDYYAEMRKKIDPSLN